MPVVAIDGPSGSGKSSVSREVARRLNLQYLDTGAMYRAATWSVQRAGIDPGDAEAVAQHTRDLELMMPTGPDDVRLVLDGVDITEAIRGADVTAAVSAVATNLAVRAELRRRQREVIDASRASGGIVVEGRDITTVVAPDADVRILLTASEESRLARRAKQMLGADSDEHRAAMRDGVLRRDAQDSTVSSFTTASDGVTHLDSSELDLAQTVEAVLSVIAAANPTELDQPTVVDHNVDAENEAVH